MTKHGKGTNSSPKRLKCPWTLLRPLFGSLSMLLFLFCLHSLIYVSFIAFKTPDCSKCYEQKENKNCYNYCDITVDDFVFVYDPEDRISLMIYMAIILLLRCIAFFAGFIGVFTFIFYAMIVYLVLHFGLIITFLITIIFYAAQEKSVFEYVFGRTTTSTVVLSFEYSLELILFITGLSIAYKFFRIKYTKSKDKSRQNKPQITDRTEMN